MKKGNSELQNKTIWIELLRIIACFCVIINHTNSQIFANTVPSPTWFVSLAYFFVSKIAVPLFVMISGYLLLDKEEGYGKAFARIGRMLAVLFVFSLFYYVSYYFMGLTESFSIDDFVAKLLGEPVAVTFWYLYMYIGLLAMLPFLQKMVKGMEKRDFHVFFAISFVVYGIWPIFTHYLPQLTFAEDFEMPLFTGYICMLFIGCYFKRYGKVSRKFKMASVAVLVLAVGFNVAATYFEYTFVSQDSADYLFLDNRTLFPIVLSAACVFYLIKDMEFGVKMGKVISAAGGCTFGIFLLSDFMVDNFWGVFQYLCWYTHPFIAVVILEIFMFAAGFAMTYLLKKIPGVKELL